MSSTDETRARYETMMMQPVSGQIGSRRRRRGSVVALYGAYVLICTSVAIVANFAGAIADVVGGALMLAGVAAACYGVTTLLGRTFVNAPNIRDAALDERQRARRNEALVRAYPVIGMFTALSLLYVMAGEAWPPVRNYAVVEALFWGVFLLAISLPSAIIAWTEPDPLVEVDA